MLGRKKSRPHKRTESSSIKTYFKAASCQTSNPVASSTVPKITRTLQQSFQPQPHVTTPSNTVQIKQTCPHVQSFQPTSDTALHATEMNVYHEALTGSTIQEVPTTSISKDKPSEKEPPHSHTKLPSVTSLLLLNTKKKVCSQGNQSILDLFPKAKIPLVSVCEADSSDIDDTAIDREMQTLKFADSDDDSIIDSPTSSIDSHVGFNDSFPSASSHVDPISDFSELEYDSDTVQQLLPFRHDSIQNESELLPFSKPF